MKCCCASCRSENAEMCVAIYSLLAAAKTILFRLWRMRARPTKNNLNSNGKLSTLLAWHDKTSQWVNNKQTCIKPVNNGKWLEFAQCKHAAGVCLHACRKTMRPITIQISPTLKSIARAHISMAIEMCATYGPAIIWQSRTNVTI